MNRLMICYFYGHLPKANEVVDHIDGDTLNNRLTNLRVVTQEINLTNKKYKKGEEVAFTLPNGQRIEGIVV